MKASANCIAVIKHCEKCALKAYADPKSPLAEARRAGRPTAGLSGAPWTVGFGATGPDIGPNTVWTQEQADQRLLRDVFEREEDANQAIRVMVTQGIFDAFVDILFNVGHGSPAKDGIVRLKNGNPSTLLRKLNAADFEGARAELAKWISPGTSVEKGLRKRRAMDMALWDGLSGSEAIRLGEGGAAG